MAQYPCPYCKKSYHYPSTLAIHTKNYHPEMAEQKPSFSQVVEKSLKEMQESLKQQMNQESKYWSTPIQTTDLDAHLTTYKEKHHKEKPMSTLKTMSTDTLSAAKKQRDKMRNQARMDVAKFASKFGCSEFEAAHAIFDTVLDTINDTAKNYGTPAMPNFLAQTLLNDTKVLLGDAEPAKITAMEMTAFNLDEHLAKNPAPTTKKIAQKAATKAKSEVAKLDIYVSEEDLTGTFLYENLKGYKEQGVSLKGYNEGTLDNLYHFVKGKLYTYSSSLQNDPTLKPYAESLNQGYNYPIFIMKKSAPYVSTAVLNKFQLQAPTGYKWRKLKNKDIYKLIKDPKQSWYWTQKEKDAEAAKVVVSDVPFLKQVVSTMLTAFNTKAGCYDTLWSNVNYPGHFVKTYELPDNYSWNLNHLLDVAKIHPSQPEVENG